MKNGLFSIPILAHLPKQNISSIQSENVKLEFIEKNKTNKKIVFVELDEDTERELEKHILEIEKLLEADELPKVINKASCKKCAYYEYCYI